VTATSSWELSHCFSVFSFFHWSSEFVTTSPLCCKRVLGLLSFFSINTRPPVALQLKLRGPTIPAPFFLRFCGSSVLPPKNNATEQKRKRAATNWAKTNMLPTFVFLNDISCCYPFAFVSPFIAAKLLTGNGLLSSALFADCSKSCNATGWHFYEVIPQTQLHSVLRPVH